MNTVPPELSSWLGPLSWAMVILALLWLVVWLFDRWQQKRYNLISTTEAERKGPHPDFLRIDRKKRAAQIARGEAYRRSRESSSGSEPEERPEPAASPKRKWARLLRTIVIVTALANVLAVTAGALLRIESTHEFFVSLTDFERWAVLVRQYWIGFLVAVGVILGQLYRFGTLLLAPAEEKKKGVHARSDVSDDRSGGDANPGGDDGD